MPVMDMDNEKNLVTKKAQEKEIEQEVQTDPVKLLPFFNAKYTFHQNKIESLDEKAAVITDKISRNESKIDRLQARAERLEQTNAMLKAAHIPGISAMIAKNEQKIAKIKNVSIPKHQQKIEAHKDKLSNINKKIEVAQSKSDRVKALSGIITSFGVRNHEQRREQFSGNLDLLHDASKRSLTYKLEKVNFQIYDLRDSYNKAESAVDKLNIGKQLTDLNARKENLTERFNKLDLQKAPFSTQKDAVIDTMADSTRNLLEQTTDVSNIPAIAENICNTNSQIVLESELNQQRASEQMKNIEVVTEDNLNAIDGVMNNTTTKQNVQQESSVSEAVIENDTKQEKMPITEKEINLLTKFGIWGTEDWTHEEASSVISQIEQNNWSVPDNIILPQREQEQAEEQSNTTNKTNDEKATTNEMKNQEIADCAVTFLTASVASKTISELEKLGVPHSVQKLENDMSAIIVNANDKDKLSTAEKTAKDKQNIEYINKDFYKSIAKEDRFTKRMNENDARDTVQKLEKSGIQHSAVINGSKSAVTIDKKDYKRSPFSMQKLKSSSNRIKQQQKNRVHDTQEKQEKSKSKNQGLE